MILIFYSVSVVTINLHCDFDFLQCVGTINLLCGFYFLQCVDTIKLHFDFFQCATFSVPGLPLFLVLSLARPPVTFSPSVMPWRSLTLKQGQ